MQATTSDKRVLFLSAASTVAENMQVYTSVTSIEGHSSDVQQNENVRDAWWKLNTGLVHISLHVRTAVILKRDRLLVDLRYCDHSTKYEHYSGHT